MTAALAPRLSNVARGGRDLVGVDLSDDGPVRAHALGDLDSQLAWHDRSEVSAQPPRCRTVPPAHLQHVAKPGGGDQPAGGALAFEQGVGRDGRPVHDRGHGGRVADARQALQETGRLGGPGRRDLQVFTSPDRSSSNRMSVYVPPTSMPTTVVTAHPAAAIPTPTDRCVLPRRSPRRNRWQPPRG